MSSFAALLAPIKLGQLHLKNRVFSAAHAPGYVEGGVPGLRYQLYHEEKAKGGLALTMFGGSANVSRDSGSIFGQIYLGSDAVVPHFASFADRIHRHDCALMCQISHMGRRTSWNSAEWLPTIGASPLRDPAHHSMPREMSHADIRRIVGAFAQAAERCRLGGLDGCEVLVAVHLLGQFLSPISNRRTDVYGGSLENRLRFTIEALSAMRDKVGTGFVIGIRYIADESNEGGLGPEDGLEVARALGRSGLVDYINVNGAWGGDSPGLAKAFPGMASRAAPYVDVARRVKDASGLPVLQSSRIPDPATANHAVAQGYIDMAGMTRPHMADPHIVRKLRDGAEARIRPCVGAGYCMDRITAGYDSLCIHNAATGRERLLAHEIGGAPRSRRVVVIGGGPAGMEAARVCASRGHVVTLFEAGTRLGGQILLAAKASWRKDMIAIADWLAAEIAHLGVDVQLNRYAGVEEVLACGPDVVIVATGGIPAIDLPAGGEDLATSGWDVLSGQAKAADRVLVYDDAGAHAAISLVDSIADGRRSIEFVSRERHAAKSVGIQNFPVYLRNLYAKGVRMTPDLRLLGLERAGNGLRARLRNEYTRVEEFREVDQVIVEQGTVPADGLHHELAAGSCNLGETDIEALTALSQQPAFANPAGAYELHRIGDALAGRDIHAAIHDALRLCSAL
ncbi:MAG: FAD-dependent oxidoreductase [Rhodospirillales bacterium]